MTWFKVKRLTAMDTDQATQIREASVLQIVRMKGEWRLDERARYFFIIRGMVSEIVHSKRHKDKD